MLTILKPDEMALRPKSPKYLDRETFLLDMVGELSGLLQASLSVQEAESMLGQVGSQIGRALDKGARTDLDVPKLSREQVEDALIELKAKIGGKFEIEEADDDRIVFVNSQCPFARNVRGRPALCMMTSNVFGRITADNLGYARVEIVDSIALGSAGCRVVVHLNEASVNAGQLGHTNEYYGDGIDRD